MTVQLSQLIFNPKVGHDVVVSTAIDYNPNSYSTKEAAAKGLREALIKYAVEVEGYSQELAENEISCWHPSRTKQYSGTEAWCVVWECGPYQWATSMSMQIRGPWGFCEPYYSFDLHFTE